MPGNPCSCWLWQGSVSCGYPKFSKRVPGAAHPKTFLATRAMLEEVLELLFPQDEAGHLCDQPLCINPDHLEVQTKAHNMAQRWGQMDRGVAHKSWIPVLYPGQDELQLIANEGWDKSMAPSHSSYPSTHSPRTPADLECPF